MTKILFINMWALIVLALPSHASKSAEAAAEPAEQTIGVKRKAEDSDDRPYKVYIVEGESGKPYKVTDYTKEPHIKKLGHREASKTPSTLSEIMQLHNLANKLHRSKKHKQAISICTSILKLCQKENIGNIRPFLISAHHKLADIYDARGQNELAIENYDQAIQQYELSKSLQRSNSDTLNLMYLKRGQAQQTVGKYQDALLSYEKFINAFDENSQETMDALIGHIQCGIVLGDFVSAESNINYVKNLICDLKGKKYRSDQIDTFTQLQSDVEHLLIGDILTQE